MPNLTLKIPPPLITFIMAIAIITVAKLTPDAAWHSTWQKPLAIILLFFAAIPLTTAISAFIRAKTTINPLTPQKSSALVQSAIYSYTRNPMYLGFLLLLLALVTYLGNPFSLLLIFAFVKYLEKYQIIPEENALLQLFGEDYRNYQTKVRRWL